MSQKDYYSILGVSKTSSADEIKKAYRQLAVKYHPHSSGSTDNEAKFKEINEAYEVLSDPQKRTSYDQFGTADAQNFGRGGGFGATGFDFSQGFGFGGGIGDIFEGIFGQAMAHIQAEIEISVSQAVLGDTIHLQVDGKPVDFSIPQGTQDGTQIHVKGKGRAYRGGVGDLIIITRIRIPKKLTREQHELYSRLKQIER